MYLRKIIIIKLALLLGLYNFAISADDSSYPCGGTASSNSSAGCGGMRSCGDSSVIGINSENSGCGSQSGCATGNVTSTSGCSSGSGCGKVSSCSSEGKSVKQNPLGKTDKYCGGRALAYIARQRGISKDTAEIIQMVQIDSEKGASMLDIIKAAKKLGLDAKGYRMNYGELVKRDLPVIIYFPNHFTVLTSVDKDKNILTFTDSTLKELTLTKQDFLNSWEGYVLEIYKEPTVSLAN